MKAIASCIALVLSLSVLFTDAAYGQEPDVRPLVATPAYELIEAMQGNIVLWFRERNTGSDTVAGDLYMCEYDSLTGSCPEILIAAAPYRATETFGGISGNRIVWGELTDTGYQKIFLCEYNSQTKTCPARQISPPDGAPPAEYGWVPSNILGKLIVWSTWDPEKGQQLHRCEYDADTGTCPEQATGPTAQGITRLWMSKNLIIWQAFNYPTRTLFLCDYDSFTKSCTVQQITNTASDIAVFGNRIVWLDNRNYSISHTLDLYICEYNPETKQCPERFVRHLSAIGGKVNNLLMDGDLIGWLNYSNCSTDPYYCNADVYMCEYNPQTNECQTQPVTTTIARREALVLSGNRLAWKDNRDGHHDLYMCQYDRQQKICPEKRITTAGNFLLPYPIISGSRIAWNDARNDSPGYEDIYIYDPNKSPVVAAGEDQSITLPNLATLNGAASDDGILRDSLTIAWTKLSGPGEVEFSNPNLLQTAVSFSMPGVYVLSLIASDGELSSHDEVQVNVKPEPDIKPPTVSIVSPLSGAIVRRGAIVPIAANASDNVGVSKVEFYVDGILNSSDISAPYSATWKVPTKHKRTFRIQARAFDAARNNAWSKDVYVRSK